MFNFSFGGGGPGGFGGPQSRPRKEVDTTKFYTLLGVEKDADPATIKKAFRKMAMVHHPDKGGNEEKFKEISKAYEVLSDPEKKEVYDQHGEEGLESGGGGGGMGAADIFDFFTSGDMGGRRGGGKRQKKGEDVVFPLKVTLEDLYTGTSKKLKLTKNVICEVCKGKGGKNVAPCKDCKGAGIRIMLRQIGPGMIQQVQATCSACQGAGEVIAAKDKCKGCKGAKTTKEKKTLEVFVGKGMSHGEKVVFQGEADEAPDTVPGDVVVVLHQKEHDIFKREGPNLVMKKTITLLEALVGFQFTIQQLDGRTLLVKSDEGAIYKSGDVKGIKDEGMPLKSNPYIKGSLFVEFNVEFPAAGTLKANEKKLLAKILPAPVAKMEVDQSNAEEVSLVDVDLQEERRRFEQQQREAYEEEEGHGHGGRPGGCQGQ